MSVQSVRFRLPLPPGINQQYATVGNRRVLSKASRQFKRDVAQTLTELRLRGDIPVDFLAAVRRHHLGLFLDFYFETPRRRDLDGGLKITLDAICGALELDDRDVVDIHLIKRIAPLDPHVDVEMECITGWQFDDSYRVLDARVTDFPAR